MLKTFTRSYTELRTLRNVAEVGLLIAIAIIMHSFSIPIGSTIKVGLSFLPIAIIAYLYGPVPASMAAVIIDILGNIFFPSGLYFPGFTFSSLIVGMIYGYILYQKPISVKRIIFARLSVILVVSIFLNTFWLTVMYGKAFFAILPARIIRNIITVAPECFMMYVTLTGVKKLHR